MAAAWLCWPLQAQAENAALTQEEAVELALARHPSLAAARHAQAGAAARREQAQAAYRPRLGLEGNYRYAGPVPTLVMETGIKPPGAAEPLVIRREVGVLNSASALAKAGMRVWDFGARAGRVEGAEEQVNAGRYEQAERAADVALAVRQAYIQAAFMVEAEALTARALVAASDDLREQTLRKSSGLGDDLGIAAVDARLGELEARRVDLHERGEQARESLRLLLGLPEGQTMQLRETMGELSRPSDSPAQLEHLEHPALQRLGALERGVQAQAQSLTRQGLPALDLYGQAGWQYPKSLFETDSSGIVYAVGAVLSWDVYDAGVRGLQHRELEAKAAELRALQAAAGEDLTRRTTDARSRLRASAGTLQAAEHALSAAEVYARVARSALAAGTGTALDVRRADDGVDRARLAALQARLDAAVARAALWHAQGLAAQNSKGEAK